MFWELVIAMNNEDVCSAVALLCSIHLRLSAIASSKEVQQYGAL